MDPSSARQPLRPRGWLVLLATIFAFGILGVAESSVSAPPGRAQNVSPSPVVLATTPKPSPTPRVSAAPAVTPAATPKPKPRPTFAPKPVPYAPPPKIVGFPFVAWHVPIEDLGRMDPTRPQLLFMTIGSKKLALKYLDAAAAHHMAVVFYYTGGLRHDGHTVYPDKVKAFARAVRGHPALYGFVTAKEPNLEGFSHAQLRQLYDAYKSVDAKRPVYVLFGGIITRFTSSTWASGLADGLWIDFYPVNCQGYYSGRIVLSRIRGYVAAKTPKAPIWVLVQGHSHKAACHVPPTDAQLARQVHEAIRYAGADGIVWYTWQNDLYQTYFSNRPGLWEAAQRIMRAARNGTF